ncbi:MAG: hypothetical protein WCR42_13335 [bacterium]
MKTTSRVHTLIIAFICLINYYSSAQTEAQIIHIQFSQLLDKSSGIEELTSIGMCDFEYIPGIHPQFINIVATINHDENLWIAKNIYLFEAAQTKVPVEQISIRFDFDDFQIAPGLRFTELYYKFIITDTCFTSIPIFNPAELLPEIVFPSSVLYGGILNNFPSVPNLPPLPKEVFSKPWIFDGGFLYGCSVPNIDLNNSFAVNGENGCAPAAAANSLAWLNQLKQLNIPLDLLEMYQCLSNLMDRETDGSTSFEQMVRAKLDFIEMYDLPIKVSYQSSTLKKTDTIKSTSGNSCGQNANTGDYKYPTVGWLKAQGQQQGDIEMILIAGDKAHAVTLTGLLQTSSGTYIKYKHDIDQGEDDSTRAEDGQPRGTKQERARVVEQPITPGNDKVVVVENVTIPGTPGKVSAAITCAVSESFDPNHKPRKKTLNFNQRCKSQTVIVPPNSTVTFTYPSDPDPNKQFNSTAYETSRPATQGADGIWRRNLEKKSEWNSNNGAQRTVENNSDTPLYVTIHDDYNGNPTTPNSGPGYNVGFSVTQNPKIMFGKKNQDAELQGNESFGGFSIGSNDESHYEFGYINKPEYYFNANIGCHLLDFPEKIHDGIMNKVHITYLVNKNNTFWSDLSLVIGIDSLVAPGQLSIKIPATGYDKIIGISGAGDQIIENVGGLSDKGNLEITLEASNGLIAYFDNIGLFTNIGITGVKDKLISKYKINVYPNMISDKCYFEFTTDIYSSISLDMYNILGEFVQTVTRTELAEGNHRLIWEPLQIPNGIYLYKLLINGELICGKIIVNK